MRYLASVILVFAVVGCSKPKPFNLAPVENSAKTATLEVVFVRHGETVSNATGVYNAAGLNKLSDEGKRQVAAMADRLRTMHFDYAICSPSERALRTAAPVLRSHNMTAAIWPELNESCTEHGATRRKPASRILALGAPARAPKDLAALFTVPAGHNRLYAPAGYQDGLEQVRLLHDRFVREFVGRTGRVLVVGHSANGSRFLDTLLGRKPIGDIQLRNASVTVLDRNPDGKFVRK